MKSSNRTTAPAVREAQSIHDNRRWLWTLGLMIACTVCTLPAQANPVLDWNVIALRTTGRAPFNPPLEARNLAIVHAAVFDAVNSIVIEFEPYGARVPAPPGASIEAAAASAAYSVLVQLYSEQKGMLDADYQSSLERIPAAYEAKTAGVSVGVAAARRLLARRASDGATEAMAVRYAPTLKHGQWRPTPPAFLSPLDPGWGTVRPFVLRKSSQFRPEPPPMLTSRRYTEDFNEIREIGSVASTLRTQNQSDIARLWIATGPQNWNPVARDVTEALGLDVARSARVFALLSLAGADAFIAAWDAKFNYEQWRPVTAIRAADADDNPYTSVDPSWTPLLVTPPFPDFIAGHTTYAGAAATVLEELLGDPPGVALVLTSSSAPGVTKRYTTFKAMAADVVNARVWGGIHWRTSSATGLRVGESIGHYAANHFLRPRRGSRGD